MSEWLLVPLDSNSHTQQDDEILDVLVVTLRPMEMLYLPVYTGHAITNLDFSLMVNFWSKDVPYLLQGESNKQDKTDQEQSEKKQQKQRKEQKQEPSRECQAAERQEEEEGGQEERAGEEPWDGEQEEREGGEKERGEKE
eukprot:gb/GEZN01020060.1/.p1 GENE.gb/GEZN01020060.1/~~gb/GEZN01020060.1/.p1  ORF type:complete len:158 (-),score=59.64 gb/GEZN01020060.1/:225-644(-)